MKKCAWAKVSELSETYHDEEWGVPVHEDKKQFEHLMMECMQCGLSWNLMLVKRQVFRQCFAEFDYDKVAEFTEKDVERILNTENMIRSRRKIEAVIHNARCFQKIREEFGSFCNYILSWSDGKTILYEGHEKGKMPAKNQLSETISKDLKKRGFKYVGAVTIYSHLQASGIINDHVETCFCYQKIVKNYPTICKKCENEDI